MDADACALSGCTIDSKFIRIRFGRGTSNIVRFFTISTFDTFYKYYWFKSGEFQLRFICTTVVKYYS